MSVFIAANVKFPLHLIIPQTLNHTGQCRSFFPHCTPALSTPPFPLYRGYTITLRYTTLGNTSLKKWYARRRDLYLTTHNTQKRQTSMPPAGFELAVSAIERPQTHALDRAITGMTVGIAHPFRNYRTVWMWVVGFTRQPLYSRRERAAHAQWIYAF
jgi:hypothetical protein